MSKLRTKPSVRRKAEEDKAAVGVDDDSDYINMRHLLYFFILSFFLILICFMVNLYALENEAQYPIVDKPTTIHIDLGGG